MGREIKFRAFPKDIDHGNCMIPADHFCLGEDFQPLSDSFKEAQEHYYLMQFTGLTDKNGKDIYEGDIIKDKQKKISQIYYDEEMAKFDSYCTEKLTFNNAKEFEIIGNIHENPELLGDSNG